jgi:hypothetical protein
MYLGLPVHVPISPLDTPIVPNTLSDIRVISSLNLLLNNIGVDQAKDLVGILKDHPTLKTLCGNSGKETELNMSGKMHGAGDAVMLVPDIIDNRAMTKFDISNNAMNADGCKMICVALQGNNILTQLSIANNSMTWSGRAYDDMSAVIALCKVLPDMGALTSLNLSSNRLAGIGDMSGTGVAC